MRRGVLSQLPVSLPVTTAARNKPRSGVPRRASAQSNVVTTDYGWIDSSGGDANESNKENFCVETEMGDLEDGKLCDSAGQRPSRSGGESYEVDVVSPLKSSPDSSASMDVDDDDGDTYVDMKAFSRLQRSRFSGAGRPTHPRCRPDGPSLIHQTRRLPMPLGTIDEATEPSLTKSTVIASELSLLGVGNTVHEPEVVEQEPEMAATENIYGSESKLLFILYMLRPYSLSARNS